MIRFDQMSLMAQMTADSEPHLNFETRDGRRVLVRSATGPGNTNWSDPFITVPKPGRKGRPDIKYTIWAYRYVDATQAAQRSNKLPSTATGTRLDARAPS